MTIDKNFDKNRPDMIKVHINAPDLTDEFFKLHNKILLISKKRNILWKKILNKFEDDISIISPNKNLRLVFDEETKELFLIKLPKSIKIKTFGV